ncbi:2-isopropylmalate synthase [Lysobacter sp. GW1-59]|uniref:2-isopropylmalate synthase n=1 Tax=Novilysobacter antarcticus TaxID=2862543 RepID=UPI001C9989CF
MSTHEPDVVITKPVAAEHVRIFDTSLRDGEQSPGCSMTAPQKLRFAHALADLGVDVIEVGFPASSEAEVEATRRIVREVRGSTLAALARCHAGDIQASVRALEGAEDARMHVFLSTSPLHREHKLGLSKEQVIERAVMGVEMARRYFDDVEFSAEDALRTEPEFLVEVCSAAIAAGATTLNIPDTVGYTTPAEIRALFEYLRANVRDAERAVFSAHCHNDLGLAVANSLAAIEGGARQVECTVNGIGERAGNCALEELVMALNVRRSYFNATTRIDTRRLVPTSRLLSRITGMHVQRNKAIVGQNAFAHESGIHQHGMLKHRGTYEIMRPQDVGWEESQMVMGRHSGRAALSDRLQTLGLAVDDTRLNEVFEAFKVLAEKKREVFDADLETLVLGTDASVRRGFRLLRVHSSTGVGDGWLPTASVRLTKPCGAVAEEAAVGDGPVHALFAALSRATEIPLEIDSFQISSITAGDDAQGQASVVATLDGVEHTGSGTSTDILEASALAWLDIANRIHRAGSGAPRTLFDKLWDSHLVSPESEASPAVLYIDLHLIHEVTTPQAFTELDARGLKVRRPELTKGTLDHSTPTLPRNADGSLPYATPEAEKQVATLRDNAARHGIELFDFDSDHRGIVHVIGPELGLTQPGMTVVCGDSHTATHGAFGALAFGIGTSEVGHVLATQCLLQRKPRTLAITIDGQLGPSVTAKDLILHVIGVIGVNGGTGHVIEYRGSAIQGLSMDERMTVCNMSIEAGARAGLIAPDETTFAYLRGKPRAPQGEAFEQAVARWRQLRSDEGARFDREVRIDAADIRPTVTWGTHPGQVTAIDMPLPPSGSVDDTKALAYMGFTGGQPLAGQPVDVVFIGSCTNSRLDDLRQAAGILRGRKVHPRVRMLVVPGSVQIKRDAEAEGIDRIVLDAGAEWREPGCSMCIAMNGDLVAPGQLAVSTSNRNFEGRQGQGARTVLASPLTAAVCAVRGEITDPVAFLREQNPSPPAVDAQPRTIAAEATP